MTRFSVVAFIVSTFACLASAQANSELELIQEHKLEGIEGAGNFRWFATEWGVIATSDPATIPTILEEQLAAERALAAQFDVAGLRGAVVDASLAEKYDQIKAAFDLDWVMPWSFDLFDVSLEPDPAGPSDSQKASIREQIIEQLSVGGRTPEPARIEAVYQQALKQYAEQTADRGTASQPDQTVKPLRHEIAHKLFMSAVWPPVEGKPAYGGGAPDWLDEVAAILAEDEVLTGARRKQARDLAAAGDLIPLERFFSMQHPAYEGALEMVRRFKETSGDTSSSGVYSFSSEDFEAAGIDLDADAGKFYAQARGFIDYLDNRASDPRSLSLITKSLMTGSSLEDVLVDHKQDLGLPSTVSALEADFFTWLRR